ncbi:helix-turn-helix domain-containing protein [Xanthobacter sp. KR7-225]|uniref:helix-turn-helix domain-containing protein n=1 Tax=Xanthobacter sp. KR7-225 TaxID=3156613 RepID=UPI0032B34F71
MSTPPRPAAPRGAASRPPAPGPEPKASFGASSGASASTPDGAPDAPPPRAKNGAAALGPPPEAGLIRRLYEEGVPLAEIGRRTGLTTNTLYRWIDRIVAPDGTVVFSPLPRRRAPVTGARMIAGTLASTPRARLTSRLWHAAERQVALIEARIAALGEAAAGDAEKDARALAVLARTLRELSALKDEARKRRRPGRAPGGARKAADPQATEGEGDGAEFRDLDAFRSELARRLDRLRAEGDGAPPA